MTDSPAVDRFRLLATFLAGRPVTVAEAPDGEPAYTNGQVVFVSRGGSTDVQRREVLVQAALLGAGSLDKPLLQSLGSRPAVTRRYLAVEGHRVLAELSAQLPAAASLGLPVVSLTASTGESIATAKGREPVADPPDWFGVIRPSRFVAPPPATGGRPSDKQLRALPAAPATDDTDDVDAADDDPSGESKILKLFESPIGSRKVADLLRKLLGGSQSRSNQAGAEMGVRSVRRVSGVGPNARPTPTQISFTLDGGTRPADGIRGALYPEWDVYRGRYRPDWCRVIVAPLRADADVDAAGVAHDDVLRRRLSRVGLGPKVLRARADGDELDIEALIDLFVDVSSGFTPPEHVYLERRKLARDLGVLVLLDASGSATDTDSDGHAVHDHQRRAAATLAVTLEELGDRVGVYAFRSQGRNAVHLMQIKAFDQRFGALGRARLNGLEPSGYTRLGAGIRGAGDILKDEAGTPNRLLVVLSDGFPYDDGYEGRYAEADVAKSLDELRADGVACLCLSIGAVTSPAALERVFGAAGHASAANLASLSPRMDELFLTSLAHLAAPKQSAAG